MTTLDDRHSQKKLWATADIPFEFAQEHDVLPIVEAGEERTVVRCLATGNTQAPCIDNLSLLLDAPIELVVRPGAVVQEAIRQAYQEQMAQSGALQKVAGSSGGVQPEQTAPREQVERELSTLANRDLLASGDKAPVARLVDNILFDALSRKASDVHIHPYPAPGNKLVIRYRVDGVLFDAFTPDPRLHEQLVGRIKVLAGMDVAEKRLPQDGRTSVTIGGMRSGGSGAEGGGRQIDLRVSTLLTTCGERVVIRLLEQTARL